MEALRGLKTVSVSMGNKSENPERPLDPLIIT